VGSDPLRPGRRPSRRRPRQCVSCLDDRQDPARRSASSAAAGAARPPS
jgi:hypothetical protein